VLVVSSRSCCMFVWSESISVFSYVYRPPLSSFGKAHLIKRKQVVAKITIDNAKSASLAILLLVLHFQLRCKIMAFIADLYRTSLLALHCKRVFQNHPPCTLLEHRKPYAELMCVCTSVGLTWTVCCKERAIYRSVG
jgi:hypothetical protein